MPNLAITPNVRLLSDPDGQSTSAEQVFKSNFKDLDGYLNSYTFRFDQ